MSGQKSQKRIAVREEMKIAEGQAFALLLTAGDNGVMRVRVRRNVRKARMYIPHCGMRLTKRKTRKLVRVRPLT